MSHQDRSKQKKPPPKRVFSALKKYMILTYSELKKLGATSIGLKRLTEEGLLIPVGSGIYASAELDPFVAAVLATAKYFPQAVISGFTALQIHGLAEEFIQKVTVDISRETSIRNRMLEVHRIPPKRLVGITSMRFHGKKIRIYDLERTLCDAYRLDPKGPAFFKALKRYCAIGHAMPDRIAQYDQVLKTQVLTHLRQELADG